MLFVLSVVVCLFVGKYADNYWAVGRCTQTGWWGGVSFTSGYCREIYIARCSEICSFLLRFCLSFLWMSPLGGT